MSRPSKDFNESSDNFTQTLAAFLSITLGSNSTALEIMEFFLGAEAIGLQQVGKTRPISMGSVYRKIEENIHNDESKAEITQHFGELQYGAGTQFAADRLIHSTRLEMLHNPQLTMSASDYTNAFNLVRRSKIVDEYDKNFEKAAPLKSHKLLARPNLAYVGCDGGIQFIKSEIGVQQGAPASPIDFSIGLHPFNLEINAIANQFGGHVRCYADDTKAFAQFDGVVQIIEHQATHGPEVGIHLNMNKHLILLGSGETTIDKLLDLGIPCQNIIFHNDRQRFGMKVHGVPVGTAEFVNGELNTILASITEMFDALDKIQNDPQLVNIFLRYVVNNKMAHYLRGLMPSQSREIVAHFDKECNNLFSKMAETVLSPANLDLCRIRIDLGGCGFGFLADKIDPCYVSGFIAAIPTMEQVIPSIVELVQSSLTSATCPDYLVELKESFQRLQQRNPSLDFKSLVFDVQNNKLQSILTKGNSTDEEKLQQLKDSNDDAFNILLSGGTSSEAGAWLLAIPRTTEFSLSANEFRTAF